GGVPHVAASMREVPLENNQAAVDFANRVITGQVDIVVFMTGVGFTHLLAAIERKVDRQRFLDAMSDIVTIARGPKSVVAMRDAGLKATIKVPEPNTWREILQTIDTEIHIANQNLVVQEYGVTNA